MTSSPTASASTAFKASRRLTPGSKNSAAQRGSNPELTTHDAAQLPTGRSERQEADRPPENGGPPTEKPPARPRRPSPRTRPVRNAGSVSPNRIPMQALLHDELRRNGRKPVSVRV